MIYRRIIVWHTFSEHFVPLTENRNQHTEACIHKHTGCKADVDYPFMSLISNSLYKNS
jgi:hypothetical protein